MRSIIGASRLFIFLLSATFTLTYQSILMLFTKGPVALIYPRAYHAFCCRLFGIKVVVDGTPAEGMNVVYVGNHISYLDVQVVGSIVKGSFIAKKEVESWPFFGLMGKMGRTLYVSRNPADAQQATSAIINRLGEGMPLIVFPEGTSSDGSSILPFKSSFFEVFLNRDITIQPFTVSILEVDGKPASSAALRDLYAWHGDMTLIPHLWKVAKSRGFIIKVSFEKIILSSSYSNRKELSSICHDRVVQGLDLSPLAA